MLTPHFDHLTPLAHAAQNRCFGCGEANETGLRLEFFLAADGTVVCPATISNAFEGHPGFLHGGIIATLLDETMSKSVRARGLTAMTRHMAIEYRRPVPSQVPIRMEGRVVRSEGRKHWAEAHIFDNEGTALAEAKGLFVEVRPRREPADAKNLPDV
jgi:uncharacterized protein (TIGR00369 family)